jgi:histidine ammonia-lyase
VADQALISNGNFHPMVLAIAFDALRVALAHVGQLSERRMSQLWDTFFQLMAAAGPAPAEAGTPPRYGLQLRYPAAAVFTELKQLAAPATLDAPPLDIGIEDHATSAPLSVRKTEASLTLLEDLLTMELLLARDVLGIPGDQPGMGEGTSRALKLVSEAVAAADPFPADVQRALRSRLADLSPGPRQ